MDRRSFVHISVGVSAVPVLGPLRRVLQLPTVVQVNLGVVLQTALMQQCPQWCWAASASMVFAFHGRNIAQQAIVARAYGQLICVPAPSTTAMGQALSGQYLDANGQPFWSRVTAAYDASNGINTLSNSTILGLLAQNRPILYCNKHHAMVVTAVSYYGSPAMPNVVQVGVVDPWPPSPRLHGLTPAEMVPAHLGGDMMFLAAVDVT